MSIAENVQKYSAEKWKQIDYYYTAIRIITVQIMSNEFNHQQQHYRRHIHTFTHTNGTNGHRVILLSAQRIKMSIVKAFALYACPNEIECTHWHTETIMVRIYTRPMPTVVDIHTQSHVNIHIQNACVDGFIHVRWGSTMKHSPKKMKHTRTHYRLKQFRVCMCVCVFSFLHSLPVNNDKR